MSLSRTYALAINLRGYPRQKNRAIMNKCLWITWEGHRRTKSLISLLNINLYKVSSSSKITFLKYTFLLKKTLRLLMKKQPNILFVQNPSMILAFFCTIFQCICRRKIVVDAHNIGIFFEHKNRVIQLCGQLCNIFIIKKASLIIVTNRSLARFVLSKEGRPFILPDPIPVLARKNKIKLKGQSNVLFICTFSSDEPYLEVIKAFESLSEKIFLYVTGKCPPNLQKKRTKNIVFTGFLPEQEYIDYLYASDLIIDLTLRQNCLVCGAYEALAVNKSFILSDTIEQKKYFGKAAIYTKNDSDSIRKAVVYALNQKRNIEIAEKIKQEKEMIIQAKIEELKKLLQIRDL